MENKNVIIGVGIAAGLLYAFAAQGENSTSNISDIPTRSNQSNYGNYIGSNGSLNESYLGVSTQKRGIRNNNPGNIKTNAMQPNYNYWQKEINWQYNTDRVFCQFEGFAWGVRAAIKLLKSYKTNHQIDTIRKLISRWDVPTQINYMTKVATDSGFGIDAVIDLHDKETLRKIFKPMVYFECLFNLTDAQFDTGYNLI
jgi:hypothetical protein